jgi:hypothetical protein
LGLILSTGFPHAKSTEIKGIAQKNLFIID